MNTELILSIVVASATTIYTIITIFQLNESRKVRLQKETPNIIPYLKSSENHVVMELYIENFGEGVAKDVKVDFVKDFNRFYQGNHALSNVGIAKNGMNYFPPRYKLKFYIGSMTKLYENSIEEKIVIKVSYKSLTGKSFSNIFDLPFNQIFGQNYSNPPETYIGQIPYYLKEINKNLKVLTENINE